MALPLRTLCPSFCRAGSHANLPFPRRDLRHRYHSSPSLYPGHVPLHPVERVVLALGSAVGSLLDPRRADLIATLGETTSQPYFITRLRDAMLRSPTGRRILRLRPRITSTTLSLPSLLALPPTTLGHCYVTWLQREGVTPDTRDPVRYIDDEECAYVMQRYRECHDFYHALTDLPVLREGEVALKAFEFANLGLPMAGLSVGAVATLKGGARERFWGEGGLGDWAVRNGGGAEEVVCVFWEEWLEREVEWVRGELGIEKARDLRGLRGERKGRKGMGREGGG